MAIIASQLIYGFADASKLEIKLLMCSIVSYVVALIMQVLVQPDIISSPFLLTTIDVYKISM